MYISHTDTNAVMADSWEWWHLIQNVLPEETDMIAELKQTENWLLYQMVNMLNMKTIFG